MEDGGSAYDRRERSGGAPRPGEEVEKYSYDFVLVSCVVCRTIYIHTNREGGERNREGALNCSICPNEA
jgi:hypothetical protein